MNKNTLPEQVEKWGIIVVIPCYDDESIFATLASLEETCVSDSQVKVIVVVNSADITPSLIVEKNRKIFDQLKQQTESVYYSRFQLEPMLIEHIPKKRAGVGNARRTGMEKAVEEFAELNDPEGIIASLDADCRVGKEYFLLLEKAFKENPKCGVFTIQFQHDFDEKLYSKEEIEACKQYETYLRYYRISLRITRFPYSFHTIGSCFAFRASLYNKSGGMPRKQGGEDFYFLHKLAPMTRFGEIKETLVYPAPRISDRVPFGTGPSIRNIIAGKNYRVYNFGLFLILKEFFACLKEIAASDKPNLENIPAEIINFTGKDKLIEIVEECKQNAQKGEKQLKRLFSKFDAFFIVKFLNSFDEKSAYPPIDLNEAASFLFKYQHIDRRENIYELMLELDKDDFVD